MISRYNLLIKYYSGLSYFRTNYTINPDLILALIIAEASCNPVAVSDKNAIGLCQIQPDTAKKVAFFNIKARNQV